MLRSYMSFVLSGIVLVSGLVSCSPEKKSTVTKDVYKPEPPEVLRKNRDEASVRWSGLRQSSLDIQDAMDFTKAAPQRAEATASCAHSKFIRKSELDLSQPVSVISLLPEEVLAVNLEKTPVYCNFEIHLFNSAGSEHVLPRFDVRLLDRSAPAVRLEKDTQAVGALDTRELAGVTAHFENRGPASARMICGDARFPAIGFNSALSVNLFDLNSAIFREKRNSLALKQTPVQSCRVVVEETGRTVAASALLSVTFARAPLRISTFPLSKAAFARFQADRVVTRISITNTEDVERVLRMEPEAFLVRIESYTQIREIRTSGGGFLTPKVTNEIHLPARYYWESNQNVLSWVAEGAEIRTLEKRTAIRIPPKATAVLTGLFRPEFYCRPIPQGYTVQTPPVPVQELDSHGNIIDQLTLVTGSGRYVYLGSNANIDLRQFTRVTTGNCYAH